MRNVNLSEFNATKQIKVYSNNFGTRPSLEQALLRGESSETIGAAPRADTASDPDHDERTVGEAVPGCCQTNFSRPPFAVVASGHEQSVPIFQQLARSAG
jgi:hypothetical protein